MYVLDSEPYSVATNPNYVLKTLVNPAASRYGTGSCRCVWTVPSVRHPKRRFIDQSICIGLRRASGLDFR